MIDSLNRTAQCAIFFIAGIYLAALWRVGDSAQIAMTLLYSAALTQITPQRTGGSENRATLAHSAFARLLGFAIASVCILSLAWIIIAHDTHEDVMNSPMALAITRGSPFLLGIGIALFHSGIAGLQRWKSHLMVLFCLGVPLLILTRTTDLSPVTARTSAAMLHWAGYEPSRVGLMLRVGHGQGIRVYPGCSGVESVAYVFGLAVVCLIAFPTQRRSTRIWFPICGVAIGFITNAARVAWMTILVSREDHAAFRYWHVGEGSLLFGMAAVGILGLVYAIILSYPPQAAAP